MGNQESGLNRSTDAGYLNTLNALLGRRQWHLTPVLLPRKSHGRRSLVGCSPWGREESDMTKRLHFHFLLKNSYPNKCEVISHYGFDLHFPVDCGMKNSYDQEKSTPYI